MFALRITSTLTLLCSILHQACGCPASLTKIQMTDHTPTEAYSFDYYEELPADKERVWSLLKTYNHIPANEVERHLRDIREKGWKKFPYGCISHWIFLDCVITSSPEYSNILECLKPGGVLLDAGCAFGYVLR